MLTARDRAPLRRRLLPLTAFIATAIALLAFAGTAAAETKIGEGTSPVESALPGEADLLNATASFDVDTGAVTLELTTREAQESLPEAKRPEVTYLARLLAAPSTCEQNTLQAAAEKALGEGKEVPFYPSLEVDSFNKPITAETAPPEVPVAQAYGKYAPNEKESENLKSLVPGTKSLSGTTATVSVTIPAAVGDGAVDCAVVATESSTPDFMVFSLTTKPEPGPIGPIEAKPAPAPGASAPPPAPGVLSIAKAKKPLKLEVGKWATVKVKVTNSGGGPTAPGSLQLKTTKGVVVKPTRQKLPVLLPGGSWTVSYKVKLTAKAKKSSTLSLVGGAGGLSAESSLVLKSLG